jgi:N-sulfoglucosamine sulfohydrolase
MSRLPIIARIIFAAAIMAVPAAAAQQQPAPPNIVVFISDDLGRLDTSIHGSPDVRTPTMDQLAATGMVFDNAYVASPSCCPNRFSLLTGLMPARHGAHPNHSHPKEGTKFLFPILGAKGYTVASFGKVAHGGRDFAGCNFNAPRATDMSQNVRAWFDVNEIDGPVCLLVGDRRPHVSWTKEMAYDPAKIALPPYFIDTKETREHYARYLTDITGMDAEMGRIYKIAREKFGDNFIFLFTSDHGGQWPRGKWNLYDAGARVPLIVAWPGHVKPGVRTDAMVSWVDLVPTLLDVAGVEVPKNIDGFAFTRVLTGQTQSHRDKIFTTHTGDGVMNIFPMRSVRVGNYKYIHNFCPNAYHTNHSDRHRKDGAGAYWGSWDAAAKENAEAAATVRAYYTRPEFELFDLSADPLELKNLADQPEHEVQLQKLRATLSNWTTAQGDQLQPHRAPYPVSEPLPKFKRKPKRPKQTK